MGLLGDSIDDPKSLATYSLVAGLLSPGSFGQGLGKGLAGYQGTLANDQDLKLKGQQLESNKQAMLINALNYQMSRAGFNVGLGALGQPALPDVDLPGLSGGSAPVVSSSMGAGPSAPPVTGSRGQTLPLTGAAPTPTAQVAQASPGSPATPAQPAQGSPGAFSMMGVNPTAAALTFSGNPAMEKLGGMIQTANAPLINRGYGINKLNPLTGNYELDPGSLQGIKDVEAVKADTAAAHKMVRLENPDGTFRYVRESDQIRESGGAAPTVPSNVGTLTTDDVARVQAYNQKNGGAPYTINARPPSAIPSANPGPEMPSSLTGGQSTSAKEYQQGQGKSASEQEDKINKDAASAFTKIAQNNKMIDLLPSITTGPLAKQVTAAKMAAQSLGIDFGDPANNQEFEKFAIKGALEGAKQIYGARLTNQDVMSQIMSNPGTSMSEKAMYQLLKYDNVVQQRLLDMQSDYFSDTGPKQTFEMRFNQSHPFMGITAPKPGQTAEQSAPGATVKERPLPQTSTRLKPNGRGGFDYVMP